MSAERCFRPARLLEDELGDGFKEVLWRADEQSRIGGRPTQPFELLVERLTAADVDDVDTGEGPGMPWAIPTWGTLAALQHMRCAKGRDVL